LPGRSQHARRLEELLAAREPFGIQLGLARITALLAALGNPQRAYPAIHIVGTNGKTSTTLYCAAILHAHGLHAGAYISPHIHDFAERVQLDAAPINPDVLTRAIERVENASVRVETSLGESLTQFEVLTAAAFDALRQAGCDAAAVEAGLGGRHDATNVLGAPVVVLTNVALDHTQQLGGTRPLIAAEKLAVLADGATLIAGSVDQEIQPVITRLAAHAGRVITFAPATTAPDLPPLAAAGRYQRVNLTVALAACEAFLGARFDPALARARAATVQIPGRLQRIAGDPLTLLDGAHNPHGGAVLAAELADATGHRRPLVGVIAILRDKDVDGVITAIAPHLDAAVATQSASPRALAAATLAERLRAHGVPTTSDSDPRSALAGARETAGRNGAVIVAGSLALLADLAREPGEAR
jgi:dihydrofolate synthase / folylpolyglutamate synthase